MEIIYDDHMVLTVGAHGKWCKRRTVDLAELVDEPWILTPDGSRNHLVLEIGRAHV